LTVFTTTTRHNLRTPQCPLAGSGVLPCLHSVALDVVCVSAPHRPRRWTANASAAPACRRRNTGCHGRCFAGGIECAVAQRDPCSAMVMTHTPHRELLRYVRSHWLRWQGSIASFYFQRVTQPVQFWVACGRPPQFAPRIPWWQPFVWQYLVITGWVRPSRQPPWAA